MVLRYSDGRKYSFYFYRGNMIESFGPGWMWSEEACRGYTEVPIYKTIEDAKNAIRMHLDSTHKAEPRIAAVAGFSEKNGYYIDRVNDINDPETYRDLLWRRTMV